MKVSSWDLREIIDDFSAGGRCEQPGKPQFIEGLWMLNQALTLLRNEAADPEKVAYCIRHAHAFFAEAAFSERSKEAGLDSLQAALEGQLRMLQTLLDAVGGGRS